MQQSYKSGRGSYDNTAWLSG